MIERGTSRIGGVWPILPFLLVACGEAAPDPSFAPVFPAVEGKLTSFATPGLADLDGDGVPDIVYGTGIDRVKPQPDSTWAFTKEPEIPGYVTAVSGATNEILWRVPHTGEVFTTPRFADLDRDGVPDVLIGGREAAMAAFSGRDGAVLWRVDPKAIATTPAPYNFTTPAPIGDVNGDSVVDFLATYGGNATRLPGTPRDPGFLTVLSGADGSVLAAYPTPDGAESYCSPVVYDRADGTPWVILGTGGETAGGAAFRAPVASLLDGTFPAAVERLIPAGEKGVIAPATVVELTGDAEPDIVISTFDGRLVVLNGATGDVLWQKAEEGEESYHPAAVARISRDGKVGLLVSRGVGTFPIYYQTVHRLYDARDGTLLYRQSDNVFPAGAPLAVDLTDDGIEELVFFADPGHIYIYYPLSKKLVTHEIGASLSATPIIADPRGTGSLELIGVSWRVLPHGSEAATAADVRSELLRLNLDARPPRFVAWGGYMGTRADGRYDRPEAGGGG